MGEAFTLILAPTVFGIVWTLRWAFNKWVDSYVEQQTKRRK